MTFVDSIFAFLAVEAPQKNGTVLDTKTIVTVIAALGIGGIIQAVVNWLGNRKKTAVDATKTDVDTKLAYLNTVIERLDAENKRMTADRDRVIAELTIEQERNSALRRRVRELEDELDGVRQSARETQNTARETQKKCDELAARLKALVKDSQE